VSFNNFNPFAPGVFTPDVPKNKQPAPGSAGEQANMNQAAQEEEARAARRAAGGSQGTILTSPLGAQGSSAQGSTDVKTLLGATA
jgi:hypothetical protein